MHDLVVPSRIVFDLTDQLAWYSENVTVSGIQRVIERLTATASLQGDQMVYFVARASDTSSFFQLDKAIFANLAKPNKRLAAISHLKAIREYLDDYRLHQRLKKYPWKLLRRKYRQLAQRIKKASRLYSRVTSSVLPFCGVAVAENVGSPSRGERVKLVELCR